LQDGIAIIKTKMHGEVARTLKSADHTKSEEEFGLFGHLGL